MIVHVRILVSSLTKRMRHSPLSWTFVFLDLFCLGNLGGEF
jgi:hypothetical protein